MPKVTKYTQSAKSDQWGKFVGTGVAKTVDKMLKDGDLVAARMHLEQWTTLGYYLSKVVASAREEYLDLLDSEPEFPAQPIWLLPLDKLLTS